MNTCIRALLLALLLLQPTLSHAQTGSISGSVKNGSSQALASTVVLSTAAGVYVTEADTDPATGNYTLTGLYSGSYRLNTVFSSRSSQTFIDEVYTAGGGVTCVLGICDLTVGDAVNVGASAVTGKNFVLSQAGAIAGTVTKPGGAGTSATLYLFNAVGTSLKFFSANADGSFSIGGLATGNYYLVLHNEKGYIDQLHSQLPCPGVSCDPLTGSAIAVTAGASTVVDFALSSGGSISGTVTSTDGKKPLDGAELKFYDVVTGNLLETRSSSFDGTFKTGTGYPTGSYLVTAAREKYVTTLYDGKPCLSCTITTGNPISVTAPNATSGVQVKMAARYDLTASISKKGLKKHQMAKVTLKNLGAVTSLPFTAKMYLSETNPRAITAKLIYNKAFATLAGGGNTVVPVKKRKLGKNRYLVVEVDTDGQVDEADESNNSVGKRLG